MILFLLRNSFNVEGPRSLHPSSKGPSQSMLPSQKIHINSHNMYLTFPNHNTKFISENQN